MTPSNKRLIAVVLLGLAVMTSFVALNLKGFVINPTIYNTNKPIPSINKEAGYEKISSTNLTAELVTYEDGTVCIELGTVSLECWDYEPETLQDEKTTKTFIIYD